ncbi:XdhC-like protein [Branchiibius hedensis]|uniref:XdhC Rossmann domain-containing protein n=1 Tax=Branchiibius hedensis TaxID=672460 RepID=A0A2Y8ZR99_9MICO|nr:XdhC family protein [Branchiibius hedensis]PWJ25591.1 XdhC-like protein [Branchiibius hedensis]SSA34404.1 XdhC Rossmann domain-containing protein [Branchiibius hedensis]
MSQQNSREQPWVDEPALDRRLIVLTENPVSLALVALADVVGVPTRLVGVDENGAGAAAVADLSPSAADAVVLCDHDAPDASLVLRSALQTGCGYVAMLASRARSAAVLAQLRSEGFTDTDLARLHLPAGLNIGGKTPGAIALSVLAEVVASWNDRPGGPMRAGSVQPTAPSERQ